MNEAKQEWLVEFASAAEMTDRLDGRPDHLFLLTAGLAGEAGSVIAELKKEKREREAYPVYRRRMLEELGDFLWYFVRVSDVAAPGLLMDLPPYLIVAGPAAEPPLAAFLNFGAAVGTVLAAISRKAGEADVRDALRRVWDLLIRVAHEARMGLPDAAAHNSIKTTSRWPGEKVYAPLFDDEFPEEEQLPRRLEIEFKEIVSGGRRTAILSCNGINFGDRLTDNIEDPDGYRYHDVFHFAHAVYLGWSPVVRALLKSKRKSRSEKDEGQDGARAGILEEAVAAIVFNRAKQLGFFDGINHVDYDLLKTVGEFIQGFEVDVVPLWQWETAILEGYAIFRKLRDNHGGKVLVDLANRRLNYVAPVAR